MVLLFGDDLFVPLGALPQLFDLAPEFSDAFAVSAGAFFRLVQLVAEGEEALRVLRLQFVRVRQLGPGLREFRLEAGDERSADSTVDVAVTGVWGVWVWVCAGQVSVVLCLREVLGPEWGRADSGEAVSGHSTRLDR